MVKRSTRSPSRVFANVLAQAEKRLLLDAQKADSYNHPGIKGAERAEALRIFLQEHLPDIFSIGSGEAIDFRDHYDLPDDFGSLIALSLCKSILFGSEPI